MEIKLRKLRRGEYVYIGCDTPHCSGHKGRCWFCGGVYADCKCHSSSFDTCICWSHAEGYKDVKFSHIIIFMKNLMYELYVLFRYRDSWWFRYGMWGVE